MIDIIQKSKQWILTEMNSGFDWVKIWGISCNLPKSIIDGDDRMQACYAWSVQWLSRIWLGPIIHVITQFKQSQHRIKFSHQYCGIWINQVQSTIEIIHIHSPKTPTQINSWINIKVTNYKHIQMQGSDILTWSEDV